MYSHTRLPLLALAMLSASLSAQTTNTSINLMQEQADSQEIALTSITPAEGSSYETMPNISATFTNPDAVGYVWYDIYDLNPASEDEAIIMNGELRKQNDGSWATKYLAMYEIPLYEGHTYQLRLTVYDEENSHNYGLDPLAVLNTDFFGATQGYSYAAAELVSLTPEDNSVIVDGDIVATFSDAVETLTTFVNGGYYDDIDCTAVPSEDHLVWTITIPESLLSQSTGSLSVNVFAQDAEGKVVKGNMGENADSYFVWSFNCYNGCPEFSVTPESGSIIESLDQLTVSYAGGISFSYLTTEEITIVRDQELVATVTTDQVTFNDNFTAASITLSEPIVEAGTYQVVFPVMYFMLGEQTSSTVSKQQIVEYTVEPTVTTLDTFHSAAVSTIYNLSGQRFHSSDRGLLIIDGKKVMK